MLYKSSVGIVGFTVISSKCVHLCVCVCVQEFEVNYHVVTENVVEFDRRMGSIVCQAFDDCSGTESSFKVGIQVAPTTVRFNLSCDWNLIGTI